MADAITIKALQDASLDAKSLEDVVNGDEAKQVTTRKGETYPSVKKAIKTLFENGGLPATPFTTKALMTESELADGAYAIVTNDLNTADNGYYQKKAGVWVYVQLNKKKQGGKTMFHYHGNIEVKSASGNILVGEGVGVTPIRVADVSSATTATVNIKKVAAGITPSLMYIKVFFYSSDTAVVSGSTSDAGFVFEREIEWQTDKDINAYFDVRDYAGMLLLLQVRPVHGLLNSNIKLTLESDPFDQSVKDRLLYNGTASQAGQNDLVIGNILSRKTTIADVRNFPTVNLKIQPITGCLTPIIIRFLYFDKPYGNVDATINASLDYGHVKYTEYAWTSPATMPLDIDIDVSGYAGFVALLQIRSSHGILTSAISASMVGISTPAIKGVIQQPMLVNNEVLEIRQEFTSTQVFSSLSPVRSIALTDLKGIKDISIMVASEFAIGFLIEIYDKRTPSSKPIYEWNGTEFVKRNNTASVNIPAAVNDLDVFDITNVFKFKHGSLLDIRVTPQRAALNNSETTINGRPRTITFIIRGIK